MPGGTGAIAPPSLRGACILPAMALGEGDTLGGYRIVRLIGRGGMGAVYLADDVRLGRKVALKVLAPETAEIPAVRERFVRESHLAASLDHPNILPIYEAGEAGGQLFIAMRYVPGPDLAGVIARDGPLALERTVSVIGQVASALDAAHAAGLIHRDVKPGNILVAPGSQPGTDHAYLADFGLTKHAEYSEALTRSGQLMGSVGYVAPEQIENRPIDGRVDVYSLGCVLYECLAGSQPYPRDTEMATLYALVQAPPPSLAAVRPELPPTLDAVIAKALAKDPEERYSSAGALAQALASAAAPDATARHLTRGFLFADLRGYTAFVEAHGDAAAAQLLDAYRRLVRDVVRRFGGAEIKTEGDSFYVVFPSASEAVRCGLALVTAAAGATADHPARPIAVGVGVHAGETAETPEGYVGSAVNLAARLCAGAAAGEVLVSDTVRGLTRTGGEVSFISHGRKHLKGIAEPIHVYAATAAIPGAAGVVPPARPPITTRLFGFGDPRRVVVAAGGAAGAVALAALLVAGAFGGGFGATPRPSASGGLGAAASGSPSLSSAGPAFSPLVPRDVVVSDARTFLAPDVVDCAVYAGQSRLFEMGIDGAHPVQVFPVTHVFQFDPAWSPNGTRVAFIGLDGFGNAAVQVAAPNGSETRALPGYRDEGGHLARPANPAWSPDGTKIAAIDEADQRVLVWTVADSGPPTIVAQPSPDPTGKTTPPPPGQGIYYAGPKGNGDYSGVALTWTPNGELVIGRERITGPGAPADALPAAGKLPVAEAQWSPDGGTVALSMVAGVQGTGFEQGFEIYLGPPAGPFKAVTSKGNNGSPAWSPAGSQLLFTSTRDGQPELYVMDADGNAQKRLTTSAGGSGVCSGSWAHTAVPLASPAPPAAPGASAAAVAYQLGSLPPGTYLDTSFDPTFQFSIGSGWDGRIDAPDAVELSYGTGGIQDEATIIGSTIRVVYADPCPGSATRLVGSTSHDIVAWLETIPELKTSNLRPVTLGGYGGLALDATDIKPVTDRVCLTGGRAGPNAADLWLYPVGEDPGEHMSVGDFARITIVDVRGQAVAFIFSAPGKQFGTVATQMQPFIDSLTFPLR